MAFGRSPRSRTKSSACIRTSSESARRRRSSWQKRSRYIPNELDHAYRICDLALASNIPLPELTPENVFAVECRFEILPPENPSPGHFVDFTIGLLRKTARRRRRQRSLGRFRLHWGWLSAALPFLWRFLPVRRRRVNLMPSVAGDTRGDSTTSVPRSSNSASAERRN